MYKLKLATTDEEIFNFEKMRTEVFSYGKTITNIKQASYANAIRNGDMLAFQCFNDKKLIGGMLLRLDECDIKVSRLFVDKSERRKGAGSYMLDYISNNKDFFEDYYATDIYGIVTEPTELAMEFYDKKGFEYFGSEMYKQYQK